MEGEGGVTRSIIDEAHLWDIQGHLKECEIGLLRSFIDEVHSSHIHET